jgi:hypothetical protein
VIWSSTTTKVALAVAGLAVGALAVSGYIGERERRIKAETVAETQQAVQKGLTQQIADLQKQMADRDAAYQEQLKVLDSRFQAAASPAQIAQLIGQVMGLKQPIQIVQPLPTKENPNPAPIATVSLEDAPQVKAYVQECETCKLQLPKLQADLADTKTKLDLQIKTTTSVQTDLNAANEALKGGTKWQRFKKALKYLGIGAAAGATALCATNHCKL